MLHPSTTSPQHAHASMIAQSLQTERPSWAAWAAVPQLWHMVAILRHAWAKR